MWDHLSMNNIATWSFISRKCSKKIREYKVLVVRSRAGESTRLSEWINEGIANFVPLFRLLRFANRAALEAMNQLLPPRPALLIRLTLELTISGIG